MARPLKEDLTGKRYGRLVVIRRNGTTPGRGNQPLWWCRCDCGVEKNVQGNAMRRGYAKSCGCWRVEMPTLLKRTHGKTRSKIYRVWQGMKNRCHNPNQPHYPRYGGRGIRVCDIWRNSFEAFYLDMGEPPKDGQRWTLDRMDVLKGYEPGNVRWTTYKQQNDPANKRPKLDVYDVLDQMKSDPEFQAKLRVAMGEMNGQENP